MAAVKQITGVLYGKLTPLCPTEARENGSVVWLMRCACGADVSRSVRRVEADLRQDVVSRCPKCVRLARRAKTNDLTGHRYGKLTVNAYHAGGGGYSGAYWDCVCDCGESTVVRGKDMRLGTTTSCGCAKGASGLKKAGLPWRGAAVATRERYGQLVVDGFAEMRAGIRYFTCTCDCGEETIVRGTLLRNGQTKSCGCLKRTAWMRRPALPRLAA